MVNDTHAKNDADYPLAHTQATRMLAAALEARPGLSQRTLAHTLHYKSSVVISHMSSGRAPIPIERALDIADALEMDRGEFLLAVLEQRFPSIDFQAILPSPAQLPGQERPSRDSKVIADLERIAGTNFGALPEERLQIIKDVLSDRAPSRRWLTLDELPFVEDLRGACSELKSGGPSLEKRARIVAAARS